MQRNSVDLRNGVDPNKRPSVTEFRLSDRVTETIGDRVKRIRKAKGIGRSSLARMAGMAYSTLADLENGGQDKTTFLPALARALEVHVAYLETGKGPCDLSEEAPPAVAYLSEREEDLLRRFRAASPAVKRAIEGAAGRPPESPAPETKPPRRPA